MHNATSPKKMANHSFTCTDKIVAYNIHINKLKLLVHKKTGILGIMEVKKLLLDAKSGQCPDKHGISCVRAFNRLFSLTHMQFQPLDFEISINNVASSQLLHFFYQMAELKVHEMTFDGDDNGTHF